MTVSMAFGFLATIMIDGDGTPTWRHVLARA